MRLKKQKDCLLPHYNKPGAWTAPGLMYYPSLTTCPTYHLRILDNWSHDCHTPCCGGTRSARVTAFGPPLTTDLAYQISPIHPESQLSPGAMLTAFTVRRFTHPHPAKTPHRAPVHHSRDTPPGRWKAASPFHRRPSGAHQGTPQPARAALQAGGLGSASTGVGARGVASE